MRMNSSQMPSSAPPHLIRQHSAPEYLNQPPSAQPLFHPQQQNFQSRSPQFKPNSTTNPTAADRGPQGVRPGAPRGPRPTDGFKPALYPSVKVAHSIGVSKPSSAENKTTTSAAVNNKPVSSFKPAPIESSSATSATPAATASAATTAITSVSSSTAASASTNKTTPAPLIRIVSDSITGSATAKPVIMSRIGQTIKSTTSTSSTAGEATAAKVTAPTPVVAPPTLMQDLKSSSSIFDLVGGFNLIKDKSNDQQKESTAVEHKNDKDEDNDNDDNEDDEQKIVPTSSSFSLRQLSTSSTGSKSVNDIANLDEPQSSVETTDSLLTRSPSFSASAWGRGLTPRPVLKQNSDQQEVETATVSSVVIDSSSQVVSESQTVSVTPASVPINTPAPASQAPVVAATGAEKFRMEMKAAVAAIKRAPPPQPQSQAQQVERSSTSSTTTTASLHRDMLIKKRAAESQITKDTHKIPTKPSSSPVSKRIIESDTESNVGKDNDTDIGDNDTDNVQKESIERKKASVLLGSKSPSKTPSRSPTAKAAIKSQFKPKSPQPMSDDTSGVGLKRKPSSDSIESSSQLGQIGKNEPIDETTATATATTTTATDGINELTTVPTPQPPFLVSAVVAKKKPGPKQRAREREQNAILQQSMGIAPVIPTKQSKPRVINELKSTVAYSDKNAPVAQPVVCSSNQRQPRTGPPMPTVVAKYRTPLPKVTLNKVNIIISTISFYIQYICNMHSYILGDN